MSHIILQKFRLRPGRLGLIGLLVGLGVGTPLAGAQTKAPAGALATRAELWQRVEKATLPQVLAALAEVAKQPPGTFRNDNWEAWWLRRTELDPKEAWRAAQTAALPPHGIEREAKECVLEAWAQADGKAARQTVLELRTPRRQMGVAVLSALVASDPAAAWAWEVEQNFSALADPTDRATAGSFTDGSLLQPLFDAWCRIDAARALAAWDKIPAGDLRGRTGKMLFQAWGARDHEAATRAAQGLSDPAEGSTMMGAVLLGYATVDPKSAWSTMQSGPPQWRTGQTTYAVLRAWVLRDLDAALPVVAGVTDADLRRQIYFAAIWSNPKNTLERAEALGNKEVISSIKEDIVMFLRPELPELMPVAATLIEAEPPGLERNRHAALLAVVWLRRDPVTAVKWFDQIGVPQDIAFNELAVVTELARYDFNAALRYVAKCGNADSREFMYRFVAGAIIGQDGIARLIAIATALPPRQARLILLESAYSAQRPKHPLESAQAMLGLVEIEGGTKDHHDYLNVYGHDATSVAKENWEYLTITDAATAVKVSESLPEKYRSAVQAWVAHELAYTDLAKATTLALANADSTAKEYALEGCLDAIQYLNPAMAAEWLRNLPSGAYDATLYESLARTWWEADPLAALAWAKTLPKGSKLDAAAGALAASEVQYDPANALTWALLINDDKRRIESVGQVLEEWHKQNELAAQIAARKLSDVIKIPPWAKGEPK